MIAHDVLSYLCAGCVGFGRRRVRITPYRYDDCDRSLYNPGYRLEMREGRSPAVASDDPDFDENEYYAPYVRYEKPENGSVPAIQLLALYSAEPDWGMDGGLRLAPVDSLLGGSQGYRHLRYSLCFLRAGIAHRRMFFFDRLSAHAFGCRDAYWGIRFAARAIHYMEDLLTPFHVKPFPELFLLRKLFDPRGLFHYTRNCHMNYERLTGYHLWHGNPELTEPIVGARVLSFSDMGAAVMKTRRRVGNLVPVIFRECRMLWGERMSDGPLRITAEEIARITPSSRLIAGTRAWLEYAASAVKAYIADVLKPRMGDAPP
jgi:hypothetical protein